MSSQRVTSPDWPLGRPLASLKNLEGRQPQSTFTKIQPPPANTQLSSDNKRDNESGLTSNTKRARIEEARSPPRLTSENRNRAPVPYQSNQLPFKIPAFSQRHQIPQSSCALSTQVTPLKARDLNKSQYLKNDLLETKIPDNKGLHNGAIMNQRPLPDLKYDRQESRVKVSSSTTNEKARVTVPALPTNEKVRVKAPALQTLHEPTPRNPIERPPTYPQRPHVSNTKDKKVDVERTSKRSITANTADKKVTKSRALPGSPFIPHLPKQTSFSRKSSNAVQTHGVLHNEFDDDAGYDDLLLGISTSKKELHDPEQSRALHDQFEDDECDTIFSEIVNSGHLDQRTPQRSTKDRETSKPTRLEQTKGKSAALLHPNNDKDYTARPRRRNKQEQIYHSPYVSDDEDSGNEELPEAPKRNFSRLFNEVYNDTNYLPTAAELEDEYDDEDCDEENEDYEDVDDIDIIGTQDSPHDKKAFLQRWVAEIFRDHNSFESIKRSTKFKQRLSLILVALIKVANENEPETNPMANRPMTPAWVWFLRRIDYQYTLHMLLTATPSLAQHILGAEVITDKELLKLPSNYAHVKLRGVYVDVCVGSAQYDLYVGSATGINGLCGRLSTYRHPLRPKKKNISTLRKEGNHGAYILRPGVSSNPRMIGVFDHGQPGKPYIMLYELIISILLGCFKSITGSSQWHTKAALDMVHAADPSDIRGLLHIGLNGAVQSLQGLGVKLVNPVCAKEDCGATSTRRDQWYNYDPRYPYDKVICESCARYRLKYGKMKPKALVDRRKLRSETEKPANQLCPECTTWIAPNDVKTGKVAPPAGHEHFNKSRSWSFDVVSGEWLCTNCKIKRDNARNKKPRKQRANNYEARKECPNPGTKWCVWCKKTIKLIFNPHTEENVYKWLCSNCVTHFKNKAENVKTRVDNRPPPLGLPCPLLDPKTKKGCRTAETNKWRQLPEEEGGQWVCLSCFEKLERAANQRARAAERLQAQNTKVHDASDLEDGEIREY